MKENRSMNDRDNRVREVGYLLRDFLKVIKVVSMYPEDNPLPQSLRRSFAERLVSVIETIGDIYIEIEKDTLAYDAEVVYTDKSKEENLAGTFFGAGFTALTFKIGLDVNDIYKLLDVVKFYINSNDRTLDLAELVWQAEITGFSFQTVEDIALSEYDSSFNIQEYLTEEDSSKARHGQFGADGVDYSSVFDHNSAVPEVDADEISDYDRIEGYESRRVPVDRPTAGNASTVTDCQTDTFPKGGQAPAGVETLESIDLAVGEGEDDGAAEVLGHIAEGLGIEVGLESPAAPAAPDASLILNKEFQLSGEQEKEISRRLSEDADFDPYESILELLKEMLLQEPEMDDFYETVTICEKVGSEFIRDGRLLEAGRLLEYIKSLETQIRSEKPLWAERLKEAGVTAGSRDRLKVLSESLNTHEHLGVRDIRCYLDNFGWEALGNITDIMGNCIHRLHRDAVKDYLTGRGRDRVDVIAKGIYDKRPEVVRSSVAILASIGDSKALSILGRAVDHDNRDVRLDLVRGLAECEGEQTLKLLSRCARDTDREVRQEAVGNIVTRRGTAAFETIAEIINDQSAVSLEREDQLALLKAYSTLGSDAAVGYLIRLATQWNLFRDSTIAFLRGAAFEALAVNQSEKCERMLVKLSGSWRPDIRRLAAATLQHRREVLYGDE